MIGASRIGEREVSVQSEEITKRRRAIWYDRPSATDAERADVQKFFDFRFPNLRQIEELRQQLTLVRGEAAELERRGFSGRELSDLKFDAVKLSGEIEALLADGRCPNFLRRNF
jgi:hypothetical protein